MADVKISALSSAPSPLPADTLLPAAGTVSGSLANFAVTRQALALPAFHPGFRSGARYLMHPYGGLGTGAAPNAVDTLYLQPFMCHSATVPWLGVTVRCTAGGGAGSQIKCALYGFNTATGGPTAVPLAVGGAAASTASSSDVTMTFATPFQPTLGAAYYWGWVINTASPLPQFHNHPNTGGEFIFMAGTALGNSGGGTAKAMSIACPFATDLNIFDPSAATPVAILAMIGQIQT